MTIKEIYQSAKNVAKAAVALAIYGQMSLNLALSLGPNPAITGHYSADVCTGRIKMNSLENKFYNYAFDKLGIDNTLLEKK